MKFLVIGAVLLLIVGGAWFSYTNLDKQPIEEKEITVVNKKEGIEVTKTNVVESGGSRLPKGFPTDIPVEATTVGDSYKAFYEKVGVTQYTVSYTSNKTKNELWDIYDKFMQGAGYTIQPYSSVKSTGQISGMKGDDSLSIIISSQKSVSLVQISYLDRAN